MHKLICIRRCIFLSKKNFNDENENIEDTTKYGEFVSSYFAWIPLPKQKQRAEELEKMTKNKEDNDDI